MPVTGVTDCYLPPSRGLEANLGLLEKQQVLLTNSHLFKPSNSFNTHRESSVICSYILPIKQGLKKKNEYSIPSPVLTIKMMQIKRTNIFFKKGIRVLTVLA